jgi:hypothetical protein
MVLGPSQFPLLPKLVKKKTLSSKVAKKDAKKSSRDLLVNSQ